MPTLFPGQTTYRVRPPEPARENVSPEKHDVNAFPEERRSVFFSLSRTHYPRSLFSLMQIYGSGPA